MLLVHMGRSSLQAHWCFTQKIGLSNGMATVAAGDRVTARVLTLNVQLVYVMRLIAAAAVFESGRGDNHTEVLHVRLQDADHVSKLFILAF